MQRPVIDRRAGEIPVGKERVPTNGADLGNLPEFNVPNRIAFIGPPNRLRQLKPPPSQPLVHQLKRPRILGQNSANPRSFLALGKTRLAVVVRLAVHKMRKTLVTPVRNGRAFNHLLERSQGILLLGKRFTDVNRLRRQVFGQSRERHEFPPF